MEAVFKWIKQHIMHAKEVYDVQPSKLSFAQVHWNCIFFFFCLLLKVWTFPFIFRLMIILSKETNMLSDHSVIVFWENRSQWLYKGTQRYIYKIEAFFASVCFGLSGLYFSCILSYVCYWVKSFPKKKYNTNTQMLIIWQLQISSFHAPVISEPCMYMSVRPVYGVTWIWKEERRSCEASGDNSYFKDRASQVCKVQQKHQRKWTEAMTFKI